MPTFWCWAAGNMAARVAPLLWGAATAEAEAGTRMGKAMGQGTLCLAWGELPTCPGCPESSLPRSSAAPCLKL